MYSKEKHIYNLITNGPSFEIHEDKILSVKNKKDLKIWNRSYDNKIIISLSDTDELGYYSVPSSNNYTELIIDGLYNTVTFVNNSIFIYGEYTKYSRNMSLTPMVINGILKYKRYVSEICDDLKDYFNADEVKFRSAGREDADVRVFGRPFLCEIISPKKNLNGKIKLERDGVEYKNVMRVTKNVKELLLMGEGGYKIYRAMIFIKNGIEMEQDRFLEELKDMGIENKLNIDEKNDGNIVNKSLEDKILIKQKTPLRVLHRRANLFRMKYITIINYEKKKVGDNIFLILELKTDSGTYIKEFVNGDLGRTFPSVTNILGYSDLIELDVIEVEKKTINKDYIIENW